MYFNMYMDMYMHVYKCICIYVFIYIYTHLNKYMLTCKHTYLPTYIQTHIQTCMLVISAHAYYLPQTPPSPHVISTSASLGCVYVYKCICICTYIYTHMHDHPPTNVNAKYIHTLHTNMHTYIYHMRKSYLDTCVHTRVYFCLCVRVCTRLCVRVCLYIKSGLQRSQCRRRHKGTTRGPALSRGTTPSLRTARAGNGGSLRRGLHGRGDGEG